MSKKSNIPKNCKFKGVIISNLHMTDEAMDFLKQMYALEPLIDEVFVYKSEIDDIVVLLPKCSVLFKDPETFATLPKPLQDIFLFAHNNNYYFIEFCSFEEDICIPPIKELPCYNENNNEISYKEARKLYKNS